jgi:hypothetical protein
MSRSLLPILVEITLPAHAVPPVPAGGGSYHEAPNNLRREKYEKNLAEQPKTFSSLILGVVFTISYRIAHTLGR